MKKMQTAARFRSQLWSLKMPSLCHRSFAAISTYKAVIFDMYGVLIPSPVKLATVFEQQNSVPLGTLGKAIRTGGEVNAWKRFMRGEIGAEEFVEAFGRQCSEIAGSPVPIGSFLSNLTSGPMTRPLPVMMEAILCARSRGLKTAVLSNNFLQLNGDPFLPLDHSLFDVIVESCREGLSKPDPRIYHLCLNRLGVSAHEAVFLDDLKLNVEAAAQLGMHAIKVGDIAVSVKELEGVLGIPLSGFVPGPGSAPVATKLPMDQLTQYLRKALHLSDKADSVAVQQLNPSQSNSLYHLTTGGRHLLLRKQQKTSRAMETEYRLLKSLSGSGIPVPEIIDLCEDPSVLGAPFLLMEVCLGRMFSDPSLPGLTPGDRRALYQAMQHTLCQIHCLDPRAVGLEDYGEPVDYMGLQVQWWTQQYRDSETPPIPAMERLIQWLPLHLPKHQRSTLIHGSFRLENLVFHPEKPEVVAVMDWGRSRLGDPLTDLTFSCMAHCLPQDNPLLTGISDRGLVQLGIPTVEEVMGQYCSSMGLEEGVPDWNFYMAFHLFCLAASRQGESKSTIAGQTGSGRLAEQVADLAWDFATKEGFRIFNAMPRSPHAGTSPLKGQVAE
ncbi:acyl-CoA dehydrogenase family member 10 isoform X3 [Oncorhynchus mykiss]|uniref:Aminoglycoside phosphotransferase domain-containing protein n=2 Tax=Oncorhynchus mykiss TaxID=8022 RepID=A0A8C7LKS0_ONCMY|nr:acyl-CoA dehydrogenase family member 10 isoform X3 [Oncorhynchus mykiss]XP_036791686.1 acyl-CoA dehydrogenase family member 10 isoform X3 [Oncorhynchus mykiss]XP_036791694.1 acyl-CoA dehydrogenase family member 10 isoform X3 [Oncorhynchus mykiss]XP_036791695.1 acyl-CoA dehydrogenase family member 10 isoform X3 [Oncorhynchus mykiss]